MSDALPFLPPNIGIAALLGYLNFSEGRPDPRFQKSLNDAYAFLAENGSQRPWDDLGWVLTSELAGLHAEGGAAFREITQAQAVLDIAFQKVLPAYRAHHADLLFHLSDADLWQPFLLARVCETVVAQRGPWDEVDRIVAGALQQLNDFMGHRPVAVLESRRRGEPYAHERVRPIPLYLRGAGVAFGRYRQLVELTLQILRETDRALLADSGLDFDLLDEFALDPRGYDFGHPNDKRPNYCFGEWDPHHVDNQARFRRYVARWVTLDGLWQRVAETEDERRPEMLYEAAAVLAGTVLMAMGVSGWGPQAHDSSVNLSNLVPRIARCREAFYAGLLKRMAGPHGDRLREEARRLRQPFGAARQHLNQVLAQSRALQLQKRRLALFLAEVGYPAGSRRQIASIPVASIRLATEMHIRLTTARLRIGRGELDQAATDLAQTEDQLRRGIECGALADPWNILGFQAQYPRFQSMEDSVRDTRIDELTGVVGRVFDLYGRLLAEGASRGEDDQVELVARQRDLADWWDAFATTSVSDIQHIDGAAAVRSADFVAAALRRWRERGSSADLKFWRGEIEHFRTAEAFALVVGALLERRDSRAAMALLMTWVGQADSVGLEQGEHSFHDLALCWMLGVIRDASAQPADAPAAVELVGKFFDYLEANAEDYWQVPGVQVLEDSPDQAPPAAEEESTYAAAYEDVSYQDSTDDDVEAEILDVMPQKDFDLSEEAERLEERLRFLGTLARLWSLATRCLRLVPEAALPPAIGAWQAQARHNHDALLELLDRVARHEIPSPVSGSFDSMVEFDRRNVTKQRLLGLIIGTALEQALAEGALRTLRPQADGDDTPRIPWEGHTAAIERSLLKGEPEAVRARLPDFVRDFRGERLLYTPLPQGGNPRTILRANLAQLVLRALAHNLPRQGLLVETYRLLRLARSMEAGQTASGPRVSEFDRVFQVALQSSVEALAEAARREELEPARLVDALESLLEPFLAIWIDHSQTLRISVLETVASEGEWRQMRDFVQRFGRDLFQPRFLAGANLRGILQRGVRAYLEALEANADPAHPIRLVEALDREIPRAQAERCLNLILQAILDGYDHYRDYNATTAQSDAGENLYQLLDFLRLRAAYERTAWRLRPVTLVHQVLARHDGRAAALWRKQVQRLTRQPAEEHLRELARIEQEHGMRLATVRDRLEERFTAGMTLDRLCALVEPAMDQAGARLESDEPSPLEEELESFADRPTGVGLDIPPWLHRLEEERARLRAARSAVASLADNTLQVPRVHLPFAELAAQLADWKSIALEES